MKIFKESVLLDLSLITGGDKPIFYNTSQISGFFDGIKGNEVFTPEVKISIDKK